MAIPDQLQRVSVNISRASRLGSGLLVAQLIGEHLDYNVAMCFPWPLTNHVARLVCP